MRTLKKIVTIPVRVEVEAQNESAFNEAIDRLTRDLHPWIGCSSFGGKGWSTVERADMSRRARAQFRQRHMIASKRQSKSIRTRK